MKMIDAKTLKIWMDAGQAVLVDVREPAEYETQHIVGAHLLPLGKICAGELPVYDGKKLVIHCRKGGRGGAACQKLEAEGHNAEIYNLEGGIEAWEVAGLPTASAGRAVLPLDRQVQITVGSIILFSIIGSQVFDARLIYLAGLIGAGLLFAGLSGTCMLARLLAKMPWNRAKKTACLIR